MTDLTPWTVGQLVRAMRDDLALAHGPHEVACVRLCCARDIARLALSRKLTPGESAIAESNGFAHAARNPQSVP